MLFLFTEDDASHYLNYVSDIDHRVFVLSQFTKVFLFVKEIGNTSILFLMVLQQDKYGIRI